MMMETIRAVWQLARGWNLIFILAAVWVGGSVGAADFQASRALLGGLAAIGLGAFGNAVNDILDRHLDAIGKPHRPLPSGRLSVPAAIAWAALFAVASLLCAVPLGSLVTAVVLATLVILWSYSRFLKGWHGIGHVLVAWFSGMVFVFGALAQGESFAGVFPQGWSAAALGFLWHLAREWVKSAEDLEDDRRGGVRTLAVEVGARRACRMAALLLGLLVCLLPVPWAKGWFSLTYLVISGAGVAPMLAATAYYLWNDPDPERLGQLSFVLKWTMPLGVVAVWLG
jgi:geranylgeranylglycerol-phosphate geranylgeranyltransferase